MRMHSLIEYNDIYSKTFESLWQYYRGEPALDNNNIIDSYAKNNNSISFRFKEKTARQTVYGTKDVDIIVPLKY